VAEETGLPGGASWLITVETRPLDPLAKRAMAAMELGRFFWAQEINDGFFYPWEYGNFHIFQIIPVFQMKS